MRVLLGAVGAIGLGLLTRGAYRLHQEQKDLAATTAFSTESRENFGKKAHWWGTVSIGSGALSALCVSATTMMAAAGGRRQRSNGKTTLAKN